MFGTSQPAQALPDMPPPETLIGFVAAFCTTVSYLPQVWKAWKTQSTADLSMQMILLLFAGLSLWIGYGFMRGDLVIVVANSISLVMLASLIAFKLRDFIAGREARHATKRRYAAPPNWRERRSEQAPGLPYPG